MPGQEALHALDMHGVVLGRDSSAAGAGSFADVVLEAGFIVWTGSMPHLELAHELLVLRAAGLADGHHATQRLDGVTRGTAVCVRAKVARGALVLLARVLDSRIDLAFGERDKGVALIVSKIHVERRVVLLDEVLFQHEAFCLVADHDVVKARHLLHHHGDLGALVLA